MLIVACLYVHNSYYLLFGVQTIYYKCNWEAVKEDEHIKHLIETGSCYVAHYFWELAI